MLDAGGGSGELALRLVGCGYRVWLVDNAPAMLDQATQAAQAMPAEARKRLTLCSMAVEDVARTFAPQTFDAVFCHTLIEYLPQPGSTLGALVSLLRPGGLLSVSFVNRHTEVLRAAWFRLDPEAALAALQGPATFSAALFGIQARAYTFEEVAGWLHALGLVIVATCVVRALADYIPADRLAEPAFFDALLRLEQAVAAQPPFNQVARYVQILARVPGE
jgi:2-polyprenyl-3-methyl-5-hydroxy-6-metoxy-1,4-benzoquinol methylase